MPGKLKAIAQFFHIRGHYAKVFGNDWHLAEFMFKGKEEFFSRARHPGTL